VGDQPVVIISSCRIEQLPDRCRKCLPRSGEREYGKSKRPTLNSAGRRMEKMPRRGAFTAPAHPNQSTTHSISAKRGLQALSIGDPNSRREPKSQRPGRGANERLCCCRFGHREANKLTPVREAPTRQRLGQRRVADASAAAKNSSAAAFGSGTTASAELPPVATNAFRQII
jgi:hypothetical protein